MRNALKIDGSEIGKELFSYRINVIIFCTFILFFFCVVFFPYSIKEYTRLSYNFAIGSIFIVAIFFLSFFDFDRRVAAIYSWLALILLLFVDYSLENVSESRAFLLNFMTIAGTYAATRNNRYRRAILLSMLAFCAVSAVFSIHAAFVGESIFLDFFEIDNSGKFGLDEKSGFGFTYNALQAGLISVFGICMVAFLEKRIGWLWSFLFYVLYTFSIYLIGNRATSISIFAVILGLVIMRRYMSAVLIAAALVVSFGGVQLSSSAGWISENSATGKAGGYRLLNSEHESNSFRVGMHKVAIDLFKEKPLTGYGLGSFPKVASELVRKSPSYLKGLLGIEMVVPKTARLGYIAEKSPGDFGLSDEHWTLDTLWSVLRRDYPDTTIDEVNDLVKSGTVRAHGELMEGLDSHSLYLSILVETGFVGVLIILGYLLFNGIRILALLRRQLDCDDADFMVAATSMMIAVATVGAFWHLLLYRETAVAVGVFLAAASIPRTKTLV